MFLQQSAICETYILKASYGNVLHGKLGFKGDSDTGVAQLLLRCHITCDHQHQFTADAFMLYYFLPVLIN